jgi:peptidoglycan/xylan/chitin deacetylase (PgdA/CDA1 family)
MHSKNSSKWILGTLLFTIGACTHPAVKMEVRTPASTLPIEAHLTPVEIASLRLTITERSSIRLGHLLNAERVAQVLVSKFDVNLNKAKAPEEVDSLLETELYCRLMKIRGEHEELEDKIMTAASFAYAEGDAGKKWFFQQIAAFATKGLGPQAAMIQTLRQLVSQEKRICGADACVANEVKKLHGFAIAPLDNKAFARFMKLNKKIMALSLADSTPEDLKPGQCFAANKRAPSQVGVGTFDWKNRDWVGTFLPPGQFIFTYDDGPDAEYSRKIRDTWVQAEMVKPSFFWLSKNVLELPDIVKEFNAQGYTINSHSERHADLGSMLKATVPAEMNAVDQRIFGPELEKIPADQFEAWKDKTLDREINQAVATLSEVLGHRVFYFRLPYGSGVRNDKIGARFQALDLDNFFWRIDSLDWQDKNPESIRDRVVTQMKAVKSGIILFHDVLPQSPAVAKLMVEVLQQNKDWKAVTFDALPGLKVHPL